MKETVEVTCYVQVEKGVGGVDPIVKVMQGGTFKIGRLEVVHKDYDKLKGIEYRDGVYFKAKPKPKVVQEKLL